jgi:peroxiredoxin
VTSHHVNHKQPLQAELPILARAVEQHQPRMRRAGYAAVALIGTALVTVAVAFSGSGGTSSTGRVAASGRVGPWPGDQAPNFALTGVASGEQVRLHSLAGHKTLLFFSEGAACDACMLQAANLQNSKALRDAGIKFVSIAVYPANLWAPVARQYGIHTPTLTDPTARMSAAYGMIAHGGMQEPGMDGHAFMLLSGSGRVLFHRAYAAMYVPVSQLLHDMGTNA